MAKNGRHGQHKFYEICCQARSLPVQLRSNTTTCKITMQATWLLTQHLYIYWTPLRYAYAMHLHNHVHPGHLESTMKAALKEYSKKMLLQQGSSNG